MIEVVLLAVLAVPIVVWALTRGRPARKERPTEVRTGPRKRWWQP
jgi:hypothetical protein